MLMQVSRWCKTPYVVCHSGVFCWQSVLPLTQKLTGGWCLVIKSPSFSALQSTGGDNFSTHFFWLREVKQVLSTCSLWRNTVSLVEELPTKFWAPGAYLIWNTVELLLPSHFSLKEATTLPTGKCFGGLPYLTEVPPPYNFWPYLQYATVDN